MNSARLRPGRAAVWPLLVASLLVAAACDDGGGQAPADADMVGDTVGDTVDDTTLPSDTTDTTDTTTPPDAELACTPDPTALADGRRCVDDDQCPCGAHCSLGLCVADCSASADCADGQVCDQFGRCRTAPAGATLSRVPLQPPGRQGRARIHSVALEYRADAVQRIEVVAEDGPVDAMRISAPAPHVQIALAPAGVADDQLEFSDEAVLTEPTPENGRVRIAVRPTPGMEPGPNERFETTGIDIFDSGGNHDATVITEDAPTYAVPEPPEPPELPGVYEGVARLSLSGIGGPFGLQAAAPERDVSTPVTVEVYPPVGDRAVVVFSDPLRLLHPGGRWVGELVLDADPHLEMPAFEQLAERPVAGSSVQVIASPGDAELTDDPTAATWRGRLQATLDLRFDGVTSTRHAPRQLWSLGLRRTGDLPAGASAPTPDTAASLSYDPDLLAQTPLPHEDAYLSAVRSNIFGSPEVVPLHWSTDRSLHTFAGAPHCTVPLGYDATSDEVMAEFISSPLHGPYDALDPFYTRGVGAIYNWSIGGNPRLSWADFKGKSGRGDLLNAPLLASIVDVLDLAAGEPPGDVTQFGIGIGAYQAAAEETTWVLDDGTRLELALPCAFDFSGMQSLTNEPLNGSEPMRVDFDLANAAPVDVCGAAAAEYECVPLSLEGRLDPALRTRDLSIDFYITGGTFGQRDALDTFPGVEVTRVCVLPTMPSSCAETVVCDEGAAGAFGPERLGTMVDPLTTDLGCANTTRGAWLPADLAATDAAALLAACESDLQGFDAAAPAPTGSTPRERLDSIGWDTPATCLSPLRTLATLGVTGTPARELGWLSATRNVDLADALFTRQLQRVLEIHAFVASENVSGAALLAEFTTTTAMADMESALERSLDGWSLVLHPRIGSSLAGLSGSALAAPDYRSRILEAPALPAHSTLADGIVVAMMETLTTQLELTALIARRYAYEGARDVPDTVTEALQRMALVDAWVSGLYRRARLVDETPPRWEPDYQLSRARYEAARAELLGHLSTIVLGTNPLGIEDKDLPLYFRQIATDAGSRYTAITDYILGDGPTGNAVAQVLVADAMAAFDGARQAWMAETQREINVENSDAARQLRVDNAKQDFGQTLQDLCGRETFLPLEDSEIADGLASDFDVRSCWFRGERPECLVDETEQVDELALEIAQLQAQQQLDSAVCHVAAGYGWGLESFCVKPGFSFGGLGQNSQSCVDEPVRKLFSLTPALRTIQEQAMAKWQGMGFSTVQLYDPETESYVEHHVSQTFYSDGGAARFDLCDRPDLPEMLTVGALTIPKRWLLMPDIEVDLDTGRTLLRCRPAPGLTGDPIVVEVTAEELQPDADTDLIGFEAETASPAEMSAVCGRFFPPVPNARSLPSFEVIPATCYRGSLGSEAITLKGLVADIEIARSEQLDAIEAYEIAMESCFILQAGNDQLASAQTAYNAERQALVELRAAMEIGSVVANNTADCLDSIGGAEKTWQYAVAGGACAARAVEAGFHTVQITTEANIEALDFQHELTMLEIESATAEQQCFKEAELELVAADTAALNTLRAMQELQVGYAAFFDSLEQAELAVSRGYADIADAEASGVRQPGRDPWFNRDIARYADKLELARRGAYLAVRAVEYEFQTTLSQRGSVLRAETADELEQVLTELRQITATGSINGAQPAELTKVVSLRQHLLQLADQSDAPASEQVLSDIERFRLALQDPANEVYEDGVFVGRAIPFQLAPLSVFDRGQITGVPIVSDNACGERLWAVNVSIQGDPAATFRGIAPQVDLQVRKRNTAYSNWCQPEQHTDAFQMVSVRPRRNLFRVPGAGEGITLDGGDPTQALAIARVQALLDVPASEFLTDAYTDGASTELAARPLFGDYELFIPATSLVEVDASGQPASDGLVLNQVDDILLRVDYLSVAN